MSIYLLSGYFTNTVRSSWVTTAIDSKPLGITWDLTNTVWLGYTDDKLYLQSGKFTSTVKTSQSIVAQDEVG